MEVKHLRNGIALATLGLVLWGCGSQSPTAPTPPASPAAGYAVTTFSFTSDPEDYVGRGRSMTFTLQNSQFQANVGNNGSYLSIVIRPMTGVAPVWGFVVTSPVGSRISPGTYTTSRSPVSSVWSADFFGDARGCSDITGRIVVHAFDFTETNQALKNFRASFEQRCHGAQAALRGEVAILADPWR